MKAKLFTGFITLLFIASFGSCKFDERSNDNDPKSSRYLESGITVNQAATWRLPAAPVFQYQMTRRNIIQLLFSRHL